MADDVYVPYSKRLARQERGDAPVPYQYEDLPAAFRQQVIHIWRRALGRTENHTDGGSLSRNPLWEKVHNLVAEEHGVARLGEGRLTAGLDCPAYFLRVDSLRALDVIEISSREIDATVRKQNERVLASLNITQDPDSAIADLNRRFREHAIGYQFTNGEIVRLDSEYVHAEMVEPSIALLHDAAFKGPSDEFMTAHEHYRHGRNKEAITVALSAFESTMKAIAKARGWGHDPNAPAKKLIKCMLDNEVVPASLQNQLTQFASLMEALPTVRNKMGSHGQGEEVIDVPDYFAAHALHLAAANIVLLVEAHKALP